MTTPITRPNKITDSYLEEEFERIFERPAGGFPKSVESLKGKANYLKAGNNMLKAQAAKNFEAQVTNIAGMNEEIERGEAALAKEKLQNRARIDKQLEESNLLNNSDKKKIGVEKKVSAEAIRQKIEVLNEQVERLNEQKGDLSAEEIQKLEKINKRQAELNAKVEVSDLLNNSGENAAVNANLPKKNQAQENKALDQSKEARAERQKAFAKKQEARIARAHQNAEIIYKKAEALAHNIEALVGRVYKKLGALNAKLDTLNTQEDLSSDEKARAEKIRQKIERIEKKANDLGLLDNPEINAALAEKTRQRIEELEKKANDLGLLDNPEKNPALAEKVHKKLGELNAELEIINKQQSLDPKKDVTLAEEAHQNPARPNKQQAQAPDLLKNSGKTESQESSKEGKGLLSRAFHFVQRMFRNILAEVINAYRAENKDDHKVFVQRDSGYNTSFVRINKQEFNLEPGKDFHRQSEGVDIHITYNTQHTVPGAMNLNINGTEYNIKLGQSVKHEEHGVEVEVVHGPQQGINIGQSSTIDQRNRLLSKLEKRKN